LRINIKYLFVFSLVFNLIGCQPPIYEKTANNSIQINSGTPESVEAMLMIQPYKEKLDAEMNEVLIISADEFPKERGKPETKLGNLVADLSLDIANKIYKPTDNQFIDFCLLNNGGLRTSLPKGEITRGKIFELMPFENELVVVTISKTKAIELIHYLHKSGGHPISGDFSFDFKKEVTDYKESKEEFNKIFNDYDIKQFKILTSDYLANGGDKMNFFLNPIKIEFVGIKLRDAIIQYCKEQNKKGKQLVGKLDGRITFE